MIATTDNQYRNIARELLAAIGRAEFFNGTIECNDGEMRSELRVTLIVRREPALDPADISRGDRRITQIIPVWWEYHLWDTDGQRANDFSWRELCEFLI
jgi:hypothetical protein